MDLVAGGVYKWLWPKSVMNVFTNTGVVAALAIVYNLLNAAGPLIAASRIVHRAVDLGDASAMAVVRLSDKTFQAISEGWPSQPTFGAASSSQM